jgi:hypothetical protein
VEVEFALTPEDVVAFHRYVAAPAGGAKPRPVKVSLVTILLLILVAISLTLNADRVLRGASTFLGGFFLGGIVVTACIFLLARRYTPERFARRIVAEGGNSRMLEPQRITIDPQAVTQVTRDSSGSVLWCAVEKVAATDTHAFLFQTTQSAYVVPRHAFADQEAFDAFVAAARNYFDAARSAPPRRAEGIQSEPPPR